MGGGVCNKNALVSVLIIENGALIPDWRVYYYYDAGRPGNKLSQVWAFCIPRLWHGCDGVLLVFCLNCTKFLLQNI